jgi:hypothetical protein
VAKFKKLEDQELELRLEEVREQKRAVQAAAPEYLASRQKGKQKGGNMPIELFADPRDESRSRIRGLAEDLNAEAQEINGLRDEMRIVDERLHDLRDRHGIFSRNQGQHVAPAVLAVLGFLGAWVWDQTLLAPLAEFIFGLTNSPLPLNVQIGLRVVSSFIWTALGYLIGTELGIGLRAGRRAAWLLFLAAFLYVLAMPGLAFALGGSLFQGAASYVLVPFSAVLALLPILSGHFTATAFEYLLFLVRVWFADLRKTILRRGINSHGRTLIRLSQRLADAVDEHHRRFNERVQPIITELAQQLIAELSGGNFTVTMGQPRPLPPAPQPLPPGNGTAAQAPEPDNEAQTVQANQDSTNGSGARVSPEDAVPPDGETEYLRRQLAQRAADDDSELRPPSDFTARLP